MINAKVINNEPRCGLCGEDTLSRTKDCKMVYHSGQAFTLFVKRCRSCDVDNGYLADVCMDYTTRIEIVDELKPMED